MPRVKLFNEEEVLEKTMLIFWKRDIMPHKFKIW